MGALVKVFLILAIETGSTMSGREFEALRDDLRTYAKTHVEASGGKLIGADERATPKTKRAKKPKPAPEKRGSRR